MIHSTYESRLSTFEGKRDIFPVAIEKLATAGFCWTPFAKSITSVRCEDCEVILKDWAGHADPFATHKHARPECPFVKSVSAAEQTPMIRSPDVAVGEEPMRIKLNKNTQQLLIDVDDTEPAGAVTSQAAFVPQKTFSVADSEALKDLMEVFTLQPTKRIPPVEVLVGALIDRKVTPMPEEENETRVNATDRSIPKDLLTCRHCKVVCSDRDKLFQHVYTNCGKDLEKCPNPFPCRVCRDSFNTKKQLKHHLKIIHDISLWF